MERGQKYLKYLMSIKIKGIQKTILTCTLSVNYMMGGILTLTLLKTLFDVLKCQVPYNWSYTD